MEAIANRESTFDINNLKYEFKVDKDKFTVEYGGVVFRANTQHSAKRVAEICGFGSSKKSYTDFNTKYGITAKVLAKCLNREFMGMIEPIKKHTSRYCFNSAGCSIYAVKYIQELKPVLEQCEKDNIENVAPICLLLKGDPSHCRSRLGKSLWKTLCKNSLTKNVLIYKQASSTCLWGYDNMHEDNIKVHIELLNGFKSKYLKRGNKIGSTEVVQFSEIGLWVSETGGNYHVALDTRGMADNLGEKFSLKWSASKMQKMHDRYSLLLQRKREEELLREQAEYGKQWEAVERFLPCSTIELNGYVATLIKTPLELHREGEAMHHCVGGYANSVERGVYLVYSITKDGERFSTLGLNIRYSATTTIRNALKGVPTKSKVHSLDINQHYGKYNSKIVEETPLQLANLVVESLTKLLEENTNNE